MAQRIASYRPNGTATVNGFGLPFTGINYNVTLSNGVEQHFVIPSFVPEGGGLTYDKMTYFVIFGIGNDTADVYAAVNDTAALPGGTIALSSSGAVSDGDARYLYAGDTLSLISSGTINVSMKFYFKG